MSEQMEEQPEWHDISGIKHLEDFWDEPDWILRDLPPNLIRARKEILAKIKTENAQLEAKIESADYWNNWVYPEGATPEDIQNELADFKDMIHRFECVLDHATGGRMSKATYTIEVMQQEIDAYYADALETHTTLQQRIFDWGRETFGAGQRSEGVYAHLVREIKELGDALNTHHFNGADFEKDEGKIAEELADCAILLLELAGFAEINLLDEVEKKHKVNQGRKWGDIEPDGSILHIKDGG